jgi:hypothetical protein
LQREKNCGKQSKLFQYSFHRVTILVSDCERCSIFALVVLSDAYHVMRFKILV